MQNKNQDNKFDSRLAYGLMKPTPNIFAPVAKAFSNVGTLIDKQEKKEKSNVEFNQRQERINQKIQDNSKLAKMFNSGSDFDSFVKENGDFTLLVWLK